MRSIRSIRSTLALLTRTSRGLTPALLLLTFLCTCVSAQSVPKKAKKRAKDRTERRAENEMNNEIDKAVDDAFNAVGNLFKKKKKQRDTTTTKPGKQRTDSGETAGEDNGMGALGKLFGGGDDDFEPFTNDANFSLVMDMTTTKKNGKQENFLMTLALAPTQIGQKIVQTHKGKEMVSQAIFDTQDGKTTIITDTDDGRMGIRTKTPNLSAIINNETVEDYTADINVTDTGETKTIDGYHCRKYTMTDGDGNRSESWITTEIDIDNDDLYTGMLALAGGGRGRTNTPQLPTAGGTPMEGFPIMTTTVSPKGEKYEMHYRDIKVGQAQMDKSVFDLNGVEIMEMPGF